MEKRIALLELNEQAHLEIFDYCRMMPNRNIPKNLMLVRESFRDTLKERSLAATDQL